MSDSRFISGLLFAACLASTPVVAQEDRHSWDLNIDLYSAVPSSDYASWVDGSVGKLRYDESGDPAGLARVFVDYQGRIGSTWTARVVGDYLDDGDPGIDLTEAFLEWRPVPKSPNRHRLRIGAFYPELSLENNGPGWSSPYSISSSAINTWIGEELRTIGAEWKLSRPIGPRASARAFELTAAAYIGNDPAGTLLAWKGWSIHDRQTRLNDVLPLAPLPQIAPDMMFENQALQAEPFIETDDRPGFYVGGAWQLNRRTRVSFTRYDNHADPRSLRRGQYGWTTRFDHVGTKIELPANLGLIAQWMDGTTVMGPIVNGAHVVDASFRSYFLLLTKRVNKHRMSLRFDDFQVVDHDEIPLDENGETGHAWALAYHYDHSERWSVDVEWLRIETARDSWAYFGLPTTATESILQLRLGYRLGSSLD